MTVETRSIYSGPIRRGLERVDVNSRRLTELETKTATTPWTLVTAFQNGWVNNDPGNPAAYRKVGDIVYLRGAVKNGTLAAAAFTLPVGYRTPLAVQSFGTNSANLYGNIHVYPDGRIVPGTGNNSWFFLDNVSYSVTP